jgi:hypothetical protein
VLSARPAVAGRDSFGSMVRALVLTAALMVGLTTMASAGFAPNAIGKLDDSVTQVAEGCGPGWWRGRKAGVIRWREGVLAREVTTLARKAGGAGQTN